MVVSKWLQTLVLVGAAQALATASIVSTSGTVVIEAPPASVLKGQNVGLPDAFVFVEQTGVTLSNSITVDINTPGFYNSKVGMPMGFIAAGVVVDSYYYNADTGTGVTHQYSGSITFSSPVLGIIALDPEFRASDAALGAPGTVYPETNRQGRRQFEFGRINDTVTWSGDTVFFHDIVSTATDDLRIITSGVPTQGTPEPASAALLLASLGVLAACKRRMPRSHRS